ncbi:hypothetical protein N656DRAFT_780787 [Canariomyces notabilis]|uniref:Aflatoxin regulatory protein domain-containing protein n=1 Tax=Canariomyces notabilis TaxID=2074819 RepID=A0AAN6TBW1_9PEZI|nr:hypothetical protein N656DRAFT_780787 [Canariomyces arenarius]
MACHCSQRECLSQIPQDGLSPLAALPEPEPSAFADVDDNFDVDFNSYIDGLVMAEGLQPLAPADNHPHDHHCYPNRHNQNTASPDTPSPSLSSSSSLSPPFQFTSAFPSSSLSTSPQKQTPRIQKTQQTKYEQLTDRPDHPKAAADSCLQLGLKPLASLSTASASHICIFSKSCTVSRPRSSCRPRMVGAALAVNKDAMDSARRILDCPRCLANPAAQMVVIAICDRLITWSQATAASLVGSGSGSGSNMKRSHSSAFGTGSGSGGSTPSLGSSSSSSRSDMMMMTMGAFHHQQGGAGEERGREEGLGTNNTNNNSNRNNNLELHHHLVQQAQAQAATTEKVGRQTVRLGDFVLDDAVADQAVRCVVLHDLAPH